LNYGANVWQKYEIFVHELIHRFAYFAENINYSRLTLLLSAFIERKSMQQIKIWEIWLICGLKNYWNIVNLFTIVQIFSIFSIIKCCT